MLCCCISCLIMLILGIIQQIKCQQIKSIWDESLLIKLSKYNVISIKKSKLSIKSKDSFVLWLVWKNVISQWLRVKQISFEDIFNEIVQVLVVTHTTSQFLNNARCCWINALNCWYSNCKLGSPSRCFLFQFLHIASIV